MATEIERKFLVTSLDFKGEAISSTLVRQGYLSRTPERTVRVRISGASAYLTIKGKSSGSGLSRYEWEREIPYAEALELMKICEPGVIEKSRYIIPLEGSELKFEVDLFHGQHEGLIIAEIELQSESQEFAKPVWLGIEVTGNPRYYNSQL